MTFLPPLVMLWAVEASRIENVALEWKDMRQLLRREVGTYNITSRHTTLRNPRSSAYGLGQFLNPTWKNYGIPFRTKDPIWQMRGIYRYCNRRYGSVHNAVKFHRLRGYY